MSSKILILAEYDDQGLKKNTLCTITAASHIGEDITVLVVGSRASEIAADVAKLSKVKQVLVNTLEIYDYGRAESIGSLLADLGQSYTHILASASSYGKNILPRTAALLNVAQISDMIKVISDDTFVRPIYAGNAMATVQSLDPIKVMTVRSAAFAAVTTKDSAAPIEVLSTRFDHPGSRCVSTHLNISLRPELTAANIIVSGGRAFQSKENFEKLLNPLADKLNAAIGATRAAVDAEYCANDYQVGQTGKIVAPEVYFAIGISGAIQHLAGMKESKIIIAINKDPDCEMMKVADYALKADLFEVLPELIKKL